MSSEPAPLPQGAGYGVLVGVGMAFAVGMIGTTAALRRYQKEKVTSEEFATAGRSVNSGLVASAVVSSWTWAATLLTSTAKCFTYGVSGPIWYASGAAVQVILFATLAIELKRKAPGAHTYLEIVRARYGVLAHSVYMAYAWITNILVMAMLLAGGSSTVEFLTGMHPVAAVFLLPLGVAFYTLFGGLKATFLTDYVHTFILFVIIFIFTFKTYTTDKYIGSPGMMWEKLTELAKTSPLEGNAEGSYLTMKSHPGGIFLVINLIGNFGTVFLDNGYWNKAIAASPAAALPGYVIGGVSWFAIPWVCATTLGLAGLVLQNTPAWPTSPLTADQVSSGLVLPVSAVALMGKGGGAAALVLVFMAVTSASSAEMVSASSVYTYDIYKTYINPRATGRQLIWQTHAAVCVFTLAMIGFAIGLYYGGVQMGWLYTFMGIVLGACVPPLSLCFYWKGLNWYSATLAAPISTGLGIMAWLVVTKTMYGDVSVANSGLDYPMLTGNLVSFGTPLPLMFIFQLIFGNDDFDWEELKNLQSVRDLPDEPPEGDQSALEKGSGPNMEMVLADEAEWEKEYQVLTRYAKWARGMCVFAALSLIIIWPMPMFGTGYIFSKQFFSGWVIVGIIWLFFSTFAVEILPLWQGREQIWHTLRGIWWDMTGKSYKVKEWQKEHPEDLHRVLSPHVSALSGVDRPIEDTPTLVKRD